MKEDAQQKEMNLNVRIIKSYLFYKKGRETKEKKEKIVFNKICIRSLINFEIS